MSDWNKTEVITVPKGFYGWRTKGRLRYEDKVFRFPVGQATSLPAPVVEHLRKLIELPEEERPEQPHRYNANSTFTTDADGNPVWSPVDVTALTEELKGNGPHQMLVTGADGSTKWEDRTHYENTFEFVYADNVSFEVSEEDPLVVFPFVIDEIIEGQTYKVTWDGIVYELVAAKQQVPGGSGIGIGNYELPFLILSMDGITGAFVNGPGTHTISLSTVKTEIIKIPEKYLPDEIMYEESILGLHEAERWSTSFNNQANFIINRNGALQQVRMSLALDGANNLSLYLTDEVDADGHRKVTLGSGYDCTDNLQQRMIRGVIEIVEVLKKSAGNSIRFYSPVVGYDERTNVLYYFDKNGEYKGCVTKIDNAT